MKNTLCPLAGLLALICAGASAASAANLYVATNGDDNRSYSQVQNSGTPWRTIQKAANNVAPGDTVWVYPGTYSECVTVWKQGTASQWITFRALNSNDKPKVVSPSTWDWNAPNAFWVKNAAYTEIRDFDCQSNHWSGTGIGIENWSHHIKVTNNRVHDSGQSGIGTGGNCDYISIIGNEVFNNCSTSTWDGSGISFWKMGWHDNASGNHNFIQNNNISNNRATYSGPGSAGNQYHTDGNGIIIDTAAGYNSASPLAQWTPWTLITGNTISNNGARGIHVFECDSVYAGYNTITNNLKDPSPMIQPGAELTAANAHDVTFTNNTITNANGRYISTWNQTLRIADTNNIKKTQ